MIRHPSKNYINYLFSKRGLSTTDVINHLVDLRLPLPQKEHELAKFIVSVVSERKKMVFPPDFDPLADNLNRNTIQFLDKWEIAGMWRRDSFVNTAIDLLNEPIIRRMIEALMLGPLSPASIAQRIKSRFGFDDSTMNVRVVKAYSHYFWDASTLSANDWKVIIGRWLPEGNNNDYLAALNSPRSAAGAALTLAMVDRSAESLTPVEQYSAFRDHGFALFMEHVLLDSKPALARTQAALLAFSLVKQADEELKTHRGGSADLLEEFKKIETLYDASKLASVKDMPALSAVIDTAGELVPLFDETENTEIPDSTADIYDIDPETDEVIT